MYTAIDTTKRGRMAKVTVYVPDDLWHRAQSLGDELNASQVFQAALRAELRRLGRRRHEQADIDALIDVQGLRKRFTQERAELYRRGYELGVKCAGELSYADFRFCGGVGWDTSRIVSGLLHDVLRQELIDESVQVAEEASGLSAAEYFELLAKSSTASGAYAEMTEGLVGGLQRVWELVNQGPPETEWNDLEQPNV